MRTDTISMTSPTESCLFSLGRRTTDNTNKSIRHGNQLFFLTPHVLDLKRSFVVDHIELQKLGGRGSLHVPFIDRCKISSPAVLSILAVASNSNGRMNPQRDSSLSFSHPSIRGRGEGICSSISRAILCSEMQISGGMPYYASCEGSILFILVLSVPSCISRCALCRKGRPL
jgi:hypothetical protein